MIFMPFPRFVAPISNPPPLAYMRRWLVERFVRWEYHARNFLGFVQLACLVILFKRF